MPWKPSRPPSTSSAWLSWKTCCKIGVQLAARLYTRKMRQIHATRQAWNRFPLTRVDDTYGNLVPQGDVPMPRFALSHKRHGRPWLLVLLCTKYFSPSPPKITEIWVSPTKRGVRRLRVQEPFPGGAGGYRKVELVLRCCAWSPRCSGRSTRLEKWPHVRSSRSRWESCVPGWRFLCVLLWRGQVSHFQRELKPAGKIAWGGCARRAHSLSQQTST